MGVRMVENLWERRVEGELDEQLQVLAHVLVDVVLEHRRHLNVVLFREDNF